MILATIIFYIAAVYLFAGLIFAILFIIKGVERIDKGAHGGSIGFRLIIIPGTMVFWPLLLSK